MSHSKFLFILLFFSFVASLNGRGAGLLIPYKVGAKYGYSDTNGKIVIAAQWDYAELFDSTGRAIVKIKTRYGNEERITHCIINTNGNYILPPELHWNGIYNGIEKACFNAYTDPQHWGLIDTTGKVITPFEFEQDDVYYTNILGFKYDKPLKLWYKISTKDGKYGVHRLDGTTIIPYEYYKTSYMALSIMGNKNNYAWDSTIDYLQLLFSITKGEAQGLADHEGNIIVPCKYFEVHFGNYTDVGNLNSWGFMFKSSESEQFRHQYWQGKTIPKNFQIDDRYFDKIDYDSFFVFNTFKNRHYGIKDKKGKLLVPQKFESLRFFDNKWYVVRLPSKGNYELLNSKLQATKYNNFDEFDWRTDSVILLKIYRSDSVMLTTVDLHDLKPIGKPRHDTAREHWLVESDKQMYKLQHPQWRCGFSYSEERRMGEVAAQYQAIHPHMFIPGRVGGGMHFPNSVVFEYNNDSLGKITVAGYPTFPAGVWYLVKGERDNKKFYAIADTNLKFVRQPQSDFIPVFIDTGAHVGIVKRDSMYQITDDYFKPLCYPMEFIPLKIKRYPEGVYSIDCEREKPQIREATREVNFRIGCQTPNFNEIAANEDTYERRYTISYFTQKQPFLMRDNQKVLTPAWYKLVDFLTDSLSCGSVVVTCTDSLDRIGYLNTDGTDFLPEINFKYEYVRFINDHILLVKEKRTTGDYKLVNTNNYELTPNLKIVDVSPIPNQAYANLFMIGYMPELYKTQYVYMRKDGLVFADR